MLIRRTSMFSGKTNEMEIPITQEQFNAWMLGDLIQDAIPELTPDQREFLISGVTPDEWEEMYDV